MCGSEVAAREEIKWRAGIVACPRCVPVIPKISPKVVAITETPVTESNEGPLSRSKLTLKQLLISVSQTVRENYSKTQLVIVEILGINRHGQGPYYLDVVENDAKGNQIAKAVAVIWDKTIVDQFKKAVGEDLTSGKEVLVEVQPNLDPIYGLRLVITHISHQFTQGSQEIKLRAIRGKLTDEGIFNANKQIARATDFNSLVVIHPENAAGFGDFMKYALEIQSLCQFSYVKATFQGATAQGSLERAFRKALECAIHINAQAIVVIRGGGSTSDLACLNQESLARIICGAQVPFIVGIGHEKDRTILDEVANESFITPTAVIAGIASRIADKLRSGSENLNKIQNLASLRLERVDAQCRELYGSAIFPLLIAQSTKAQKLAQALNGRISEGLINRFHLIENVSPRLLATTLHRASDRLNSHQSLLNKLSSGLISKATKIEHTVENLMARTTDGLSHRASQRLEKVKTDSYEQWLKSHLNAQIQLASRFREMQAILDRLNKSAIKQLDTCLEHGHKKISRKKQIVLGVLVMYLAITGYVLISNYALLLHTLLGALIVSPLVWVWLNFQRSKVQNRKIKISKIKKSLALLSPF